MAFTLLAMVINLFETGVLENAAGIFQADPGHLGADGMPARLGDAFRRGALTVGQPEFLATDWWSIADKPSRRCAISSTSRRRLRGHSLAARSDRVAREFPEGSVVGFDGPGRDVPVALGLGVRTRFDFESPHHVLKDLIAAAPTECGDDPSGDWYYGTDIVVSPDHRRRGIGRELYELRKQICVDLDLQGIVAGGVIPGYAEHKIHMTADEYIDAVVAGELYDPTLTFQLENGFEAVCALPDYLQDPAVDNWAALIVWSRPAARPTDGS